MKSYKFTSIDKLIFYLSYFYYKAFSFSKVKKGKTSIFIIEWMWVINNLFRFHISIPKKVLRNYYETEYGKFYVTPDEISNITVAPSFERMDMQYLLRLMSKDVKRKKKILFIDIGANFGLYTISVGNKFKRYKNIKIISFEPGTEYLSEPAYDLLKKNIKVNNLKNTKIYKLGIGSSKRKDKIGFEIDTLQGILGNNYLNKFEHIYVKLDVDDFVLDALKGTETAFNNKKNITLLVEDFVNKKTVVYLEKHKFTFLKKMTVYNSFWKK